MPSNKNPPQLPIAPNDTEQQALPVQKRNKSFRILGLVGVFIGIIFSIPLIFLIFGSVYTILNSGPPRIDISAETRNIQSYLYERYGKEFEVKDIEGHAPISLGDKQSITAKAYPKDDKELEVSMYKKIELGGQYKDTYLKSYWSKKNKEILTPKLREIFGTVPAFTNAITPSPLFNQSDMRGHVISFEEVFSKYSNQVSYATTVDLGVVDNTTTQEIISARLYQLLLYMRQQVSGAGSSAELSYETQDATYICSLHGFNYDFVENAQQLRGCWTKKTKVTAQNPKQKYGSTAILKDPSLPVTFKGSGVQLTKTSSVKGASATYSLSEESQPLAMISVYQTGYGEKVNQEKENFPVDWLRDNIPAPAGARSTLLMPDASVMMGSLVYRADNSVGVRIVHYAIAYKTYLIYVQAKTWGSNIDIRGKEFYLKSFIDTIEPLDGFRSV